MRRRGEFEGHGGGGLRGMNIHLGGSFFSGFREEVTSRFSLAVAIKVADG